MKPVRLIVALLVLPAALPLHAADWQMVVRDRNRQVEIDRASIFNSDRGTKVSWARVVLTPEEAASAGYATIKALNRYDCQNRSFLTVKRVYLDASERIIREEPVAEQTPMLVTRNSVDERLWREVCRPPSAKDLEKVAEEAVKATAGALDARKSEGPAKTPPAAAAKPKPEPPPRAEMAARPQPIPTRDMAAAQMRSSDVKQAEAEKPQASIVPTLPKLNLPPPPDSRADAKADVKADIKADAKAEAKAEIKADNTAAAVKPAAATGPAPQAAARRRADEPKPRAAATRAASGTAAPGGRQALDEAALLALMQQHSAGAAPVSAPAPAKALERVRAPVATGWSYDGDTGPENWARLRPEWQVCALGTRQAPIEPKDGVGVPLAPVKFDYRPSRFRITDTGATLQVDLDEMMGIEVRGRHYMLEHLTLHRSVRTPGGGGQDVVVHLRHRDADGNRAIVAVPLAVGEQSNAALQVLWSNLPLDRGRSQASAAAVDISALLPANPAYYLYVGSLPEPPCTEGVLWVAMKQPAPISADQLAVLVHLYPHNIRPYQPANGRIVLESR